MATSGTVSQTVFDTRRVIDHAYRRCRLPVEAITSEKIDVARDALYLLLSDLPNRGAQLWTTDKVVLPLYTGYGDVETPTGTIDVYNVNLRSLSQLTGTQTIAASAISIDFTSATLPTTVGVLWSGAAVPLNVQCSSDGASWTTEATWSGTASAGEWTWIDIADAPTRRYWRVQAASGSISATEVYWGNAPQEIPFARLNRDDYTNLPNKSFQGRPLQFWFDRQLTPVMRLWPTPNDAQKYNQIVAWRKRHIMDVGTLTQTIEVPQRWYEAIVAVLADRLAQETPEVELQLLPMLAARAQEALAAALNEERDASPIRLTPNIAGYTR